MNDELMPAITELYKQWCRLNGYKLTKSPIEIKIDEVTGYESARMREFAQWFIKELLTRIPDDASKKREERV